jgi:hypothetical protein
MRSTQMEEGDMDLQTLDETMPWEWPEGTDAFLLGYLTNEQADPDDRLLAAELSGHYAVINDALADALLAIACNAGELDELRSEALLSLGPALENTDILGFEDDEQLISEPCFQKIQERLHDLFMDDSASDDVRRYALESSAHSPQAWHKEAIQNAFSSDQENWRLSAVFCMRHVGGFDKEIVASLQDQNDEIHYLAVCAAAQWGLDAAWEHIVDLIQDPEIEKYLLLAAIEAAAMIRPAEALVILDDFIDHEDEEISDAVHEALLTSGALQDLEADEYETDEDDE